MSRRSSALQLSPYRIGSPVDRRALRIAAVRLPPRGVPKSKFAGLFDLRLPLLSPSRELLSWWRAGPPTEARFREFSQRYRKEMSGEAQQQGIALLAATARRTPVALGCYCDSKMCHRFLLEELIRKA